MRVTVLLLALASAFTFAADNAVIAPQSAVSHKPQATTYGAEAITIPQMLSYQGKVTDTLGQPVADTTYNCAFELYTVPSGGTPFWSEPQVVRTKGGLFSVLLGSTTPISSIPDAGAVYLAMAFGGPSGLTPRLRIVSAAYAYKADTANYALAAAGGGGDNAWVRRASPNDSILWTVRNLGIARGGAGDTLIGSNRYTHVNLGSNCATGAADQNYTYCTVGGGDSNSASNTCATVGGGYSDSASGMYATVGGGYANLATKYCATVGGGQYSIASDEYATVGGGNSDTASGSYATVGGGYNNAASDFAATVGGGGANKASGWEAVVAGGFSNKARGSTATVGGGNANTADSAYATVGGGHSNSASNSGATVGGGGLNSASNTYATVGGGYSCSASGGSATVSGGESNAASGGDAAVGGGYADTAAANYSFAVGNHSVVPAGYSGSAAFNGTRATASNQLCCGTLSKTGGSFTIDDPIDPQNKILNHYFVESPDMSNLYSGSVVLDANGRAEVRLPDYFGALNRNPRAQLTGVGSSDVYLAEDISDNRFAIGGKPGIKVYWQVTGDRKDQSAEVIRTMMPVEQPKTGSLAGVSWDDNFLVGCMKQLEQMGKAGEFSFRTAAGRQRYEKMKQLIEHR